MQELKRGQIWIVDIPETGKCVQYGKGRPVILCTNDVANLHSPVLHAIPLTTQRKPTLPTHTEVDTNCGLYKRSTALCEQLMLIPKDYFKEYISSCDEKTMRRIDFCMAIQLGLVKLIKKDTVSA